MADKKSIDLEELLIDVLVNKSPILFLGAGFSLGAMQQDGITPVPDGGDLKEKYLIEQFLSLSPDMPEYGEFMNYSLSKLCDYIDMISEKPDKLREYLINVFSNVQPADFHRRMCAYNWQGIYTTNIDDLVERVYQDAGMSLNIQNSKKYIEYYGKKRNICKYYKLHGCVNNPKERFTFSTSEYIASIQSETDYRFNNFLIDIQKEDFIFIGTEFSEINIDYYLKMYEQAGQSSKGTLIFINKYPSRALRARIEKMGAFLIEWTAEEFFEFLPQIDFKSKGGIGHLDKMLRTKSCYNMDYWMEQYHGFGHYDSKLYYGDAPNMLDIIGDWDFIHTTASMIVNRINKRTYSACEIILGKRLSGKTCLAYRVLKLLDRQGITVFTYSPQRFDERILAERIKRTDSKKKIVIYIDEGAYFYPNIDRLIESIPQEIVLTVIITSRYNAHYKWRYRLKIPVFETRYQAEITEEFKEEMLLKLERHASLGMLGGMNEDDINSFFEKNNDILSSLSVITNGEDFKYRYKEAVAESVQENFSSKQLFTDLLIFDFCDLPYYPEMLLPMLFGTSAKDVLNHSSDFVLHLPRQGYKLRGSFLTNELIKLTDTDLILERIFRLSCVIAPQISENEKSFWKNIFESITGVKTLKKTFRWGKYDLKKYRAIQLNLKELYSGISYYWIQLGLTEQLLEDYPRALTHFLQAQSIRPDSYSVLHAIARNYMKSACAMGRERSEEAIDVFETGEARILELISEREFEQNKPYAIHCYITEKLNFCENYSIDLNDEEIQKIDELCKELLEIDYNGTTALNCAKRFYNRIYHTGKGKKIKVPWNDLRQLELLLSPDEIEMGNED